MVPAVRQTIERESFLALVCEDDDLLRAEFEAIIEANWEQPPPGWPVRPARPPGRPTGAAPPPLPTASGSQVQEGMITWVRQRSPPPQIDRSIRWRARPQERMVIN
jgi:hypothetical protein